jgi:hypothetical protein
MKIKSLPALLPLVLAWLLLMPTGCQRARVPAAQPVGPIPAPGGLAGYQHGRERSRFSPGDNVKRVAEFGYVKEVGSRGTLAVDVVNGSVLGIPNADTLAAVNTSYGSNADEHNKFVRDYFVAAGIPAEQIAGVHVATLLAANGKVGESSPVRPRVSAYYSMLERAVGDVPVVDSIAWARVDGQGNVVAEAVYWPAISADVLAQVRQFKEMLASPEQRKAFETRLPPWAVGKGQLVIRHASATVDEPFEALVSYDVQESSTPPPALEQAQATAQRAIQPRATVIHHFAIDGTEQRLRQERRNLSQDVPGNKRRPTSK